MKKFEYIKEKTYRCFQFPNGKLVDVFSCKYGCKVDLLNESYIPYENSKEYNESRLPTIEELILNESVKVVSCIEKEYSINFPSKVKRLYKKDFQSIIDEFAENGFNVYKGTESWQGYIGVSNNTGKYSYTLKDVAENSTSGTGTLTSKTTCSAKINLLTHDVN